mmetsp:Transcript_4952/g.10125  ORF Transcript_4952/g.10125 Transcript_4952/m.10125 type:complete len:139 (+) Transcript_4952:2-418(+)
MAALLIVVPSAHSALSVATYPVYSPGAGSIDTCGGISCKPLECKPPFKYHSPEETGTCCPLCLAESISVPEDRSWAKGMSGGVGMDNNADAVLCRGVVCPPADCPEYEQIFDGRCCTKCQSAARVTAADLAQSYPQQL